MTDVHLKRTRTYEITQVKTVRFNGLNQKHKHNRFTLTERLKQRSQTKSSPTSNSNLELPKLVLCFCQKLSGLMMRATWMQDGNDSWRIFSKGLMLSHLEPRMSTMTVKPCLATSSLTDRREKHKRSHPLMKSTSMCGKKSEVQTKLYQY